MVSAGPTVKTAAQYKRHCFPSGLGSLRFDTCWANDYSSGAVYQIHCPTHAFDHVARNHPVREVAGVAFVALNPDDK
jgi:hypothetical protein